MLHSTFSRIFLLAVFLSLAACGGGSSGSGNPDTMNPGDTPNEPGPGGADSDNGEPGGNDEPPLVSYDELYQGLGLMPAALEEGLVADSAVRDAVAPAYLALSTLQAVTDVRMNMQAFEWAVRDLVSAAVQQYGELEEGGEYPVSCNISSDPESGGYTGSGTAVVHYGAGYADGELSGGEEVVFAVQDCRPAGGMQQMQSTEPLRLIYGHNSYQLPALSVAGYDGLVFDSSSWLTRTNLPGAIGCDALPECGQMVFDNAAEGSPSDISIVQAGAEQPVRIRFWSDGEQATAASIETYVEPEYQAMTFLAPPIDLHLASRAVGGVDRSGHYQLLPSAEGLTLTYTSRTFAGADFSLLRGGFSIVGPDGAVYSYSVDPDPLYLNVAIDADGDGSVDATGRISQELVTERLRLAE